MSKTIVLVDGSSYLFRAYHALPKLTNSQGHNTGAIYGVIKMLKNLYDDYQPDYFAVVFDAKGKNFRHEMYPAYKANRKKMDPELAEQIQPLHEIIRALGWPLLSYSGVEADDVLGTLAKLAEAQNLKTIISTGDKDLAQLVNTKTHLINTMNSFLSDPQGVVDKFGVKPEQIIDFLTLTGDTSDNIPGVNKVGPKTASKWLNEYHTLDNIIENADSIKGKVGEYLREAIDTNLSLSKELVTIKCDVPLEHEVSELLVGSPDNTLLQAYYQTFGFNQWVQELGQTGSSNNNNSNTTTAENEAVAPTQNETNYETILDAATLESWVAKMKLADIVSIDTETTALDVMQAELVGISFCIDAGHAAYLPLRHSNPQDQHIDQQLDYNTAMAILSPVLSDPNVKKVGQNLKYDKSIFDQAHIHFANISDDTMLQSYVLNSIGSRHDMDTLAEKHLGLSTTKFEDIAGKGKKQLTFDQIEIDIATPYAAEDADIALRLYHKFNNDFEKSAEQSNVYHTIEIPLLPILSKIEQHGVLVDGQKLLQLSQSLGMQILDIEQKSYDLAGEKFNLASPKQIQVILFEKLGIPVLRKTPKGQPSTAEDVLSELAEEHELPRLLLQHRSLSKLKSTYTDALPKQINPRTGRIHTSYHQAVTATGRLSSANPNLQNIPIRSENGRKIRETFIADEGNILIAADYSQIELRIMAHLSGDDSLRNAFANHVDVHSHTAAEVFNCSIEEVSKEQRRHAKAINFGLIYGMSAFGLAKQLNIARGEAQQYINTYFERYPKVKQYMEQTKLFAQENSYVETVFGRRLYLPEINSKNGQRRQYAERTAINAPMQGTAADLIKMAMIEVDKKLIFAHPHAKIIMQVHDELVLEVPIAEQETVQKLVVDAMENITTLSVPLVVDANAAGNWNDAH